MTENSVAPTRAYRVAVDFLSGDQCFASEQYDIEAEDTAQAVRLALIRAEDSIYHDPRVPDLGLRAHVGPVTDGDDPDPQSPCPAAAQKPVCPDCGSDGIVRDATARWDPDEQCWSISGLFDNETCDDCGAEGDDFANWVTINPKPPADCVLSVSNRALPVTGPVELETTSDQMPAEILSVPAIDAIAYRLAIASLPPERRAIFEMHQIGGLPYTEIAECTGISVADIEREIAAALTHLTMCLRGDLDHPV
ncbi:sigma factor-like helix-turn-helix DNA-binding protein [Novosphingobium percolationis]|uniref:sigma-70 region 4 domain-containing protein n=1 Tax=Novosphingobium percolationis TaxID=2871811 RepID=UPI001CD2AED2|nr:sigma-70 region 4 domain-containing protein [Novosphingobium percolationis]